MSCGQRSMDPGGDSITHWVSGRLKGREWDSETSRRSPDTRQSLMRFVCAWMSGSLKQGSAQQAAGADQAVESSFEVLSRLVRFRSGWVSLRQPPGGSASHWAAGPRKIKRRKRACPRGPLVYNESCRIRSLEGFGKKGGVYVGDNHTNRHAGAPPLRSGLDGPTHSMRTFSPRA